jgi:hypothetical protein
MVELVFLGATAICVTISLSISFWAARRYTKFWPKFVIVVIVSVIGIFLFSLFGGLLQSAMPQQAHLIDVRFRRDFWAVSSGIVALAYFGTWHLQEIIDNSRTR